MLDEDNEAREEEFDEDVVEDDSVEEVVDMEV